MCALWGSLLDMGTLFPITRVLSASCNHVSTLSLFCSNHAYNAGKTKSVSTVDVNSPPTTTVASGRCTSEPTPEESSRGYQPQAGHQRRHQHRPEPQLGAVDYSLLQRHPLVAQLVDVTHHDDAVQHSYPEQGNETHGRWYAEVQTRHEQRHDAAGQGKRGC